MPSESVKVAVRVRPFNQVRKFIYIYTHIHYTYTQILHICSKYTDLFFVVPGKEKRLHWYVTVWGRRRQNWKTLKLLAVLISYCSNHMIFQKCLYENLWINKDLYRRNKLNYFLAFYSEGQSTFPLPLLYRILSHGFITN